MLRLSDSHCHVRLATAVANSIVTSGAESRGGVSLHRMVVCGTHPSIDWDLVHRVGGSTPAISVADHNTTLPTRVVQGFGVHPWFVPELPSTQQSSAATDEEGIPAPQSTDAAPCCSCASTVCPADRSMEDILVLLEERLQQNPNAIVGEIGLDKLKGPSEAAQRAAFVAQLKLAAKYNRPVSVHCVRHYGLLLSVLADISAEDTPPAIVIHAFTGSTGIAQSLLALKNKKRAAHEGDHDDAATRKRGGGNVVKIKDRLFFGVGYHTSLRVKGFEEQTLPLLMRHRRALMETDAHYTTTDGTGDGLCSGEEDTWAPLRAVAGAMGAVGGDVSAAVEMTEAAMDTAFSTVLS